MSEAVLKSKSGLVISEIGEGSPAERAGLKTGDTVLSVEGNPVLDIVDYRFHSAEEQLTLEIERAGLKLKRKLVRDYGEDLGLTFESELGDNIHTCVNKCVFCFIHQMPGRMRRSLYLMDDDYRLSFLHGNYVTLTNMSEQEFERVIDQRLSPIYVSVHATEPKLRGFMLGKKEPQPVLPRLRTLAENGIEVHAQIVLCPGLNDGSALMRTLDDLAELQPEKSGLRSGVSSVAIVPVGLSKFREKLYPLQKVTPEYAREMLPVMRKKNREFKAELGTRFVFLSDEWFFMAGAPMPSREWYEDFPQFEDGVGTCRLFLDEARRVIKHLPERLEKPFACTLITSKLPGGVIRHFADTLNQVQNLTVNVCVIENRFFGENINVAGLITAQDIAAQLKEFDPHPTVFIPSICLRDDTLFLDDITLDELRENTGFDLRVVKPKPKALWENILAAVK